MRIKLQLPEQANGTLPYPYFISEDGSVGRQDFWKGNPKKLIGFSAEPEAGSIDLSVEELFRDAWNAQGLYAVFENEDGEWVTQTTAIESAKVIDEK